MAGGALALGAALVAYAASRGWLPARGPRCFSWAISPRTCCAAAAGLNPMVSPAFFQSLSRSVAGGRNGEGRGGTALHLRPGVQPRLLRGAGAAPGEHEVWSFAVMQEALVPHFNLALAVPSALGLDQTMLAPEARILAPEDAEPRALARIVERLREAAVTHVVAAEPLSHPDLDLMLELAPARIAPLRLYLYRLRARGRDSSFRAQGRCGFWLETRGPPGGRGGGRERRNPGRSRRLGRGWTVSVDGTCGRLERTAERPSRHGPGAGSPPGGVRLPAPRARRRALPSARPARSSSSSCCWSGPAPASPPRSRGLTRPRSGRYDAPYTRAPTYLAIVAIIPARFGSTRLPGEASLRYPRQADDPARVRARARSRRGSIACSWPPTTSASRPRCARFGGEVVMTSAAHAAGTDRLAEVGRGRSKRRDRGERPGRRAPARPRRHRRRGGARSLGDPAVPLATLSLPLTSAEEMLSPAVVKVVIDGRGDALYFSRSPIPFVRSGAGDSGAAAAGGGPGARPQARGPLRLPPRGAPALRRPSPSPLELAEGLEQLRALHHGMRMRVVPRGGRGRRGRRHAGGPGARPRDPGRGDRR